jgi:predicted ATP-grasp superfamily ATP-dependent carboligase
VKGTVVVTDGEQRAALAIVRSLGRQGYGCIVCSTDGHSLAGASRYAAADHQVPDPLREPEGFVAAVAGITRAVGARLVLPVTEAAILALLPARGRLPPAHLPLPPLESFRWMTDKARVLVAASALGIAIPDQRRIETPAELAAADVAFPVVVKPARSVAVHEGERIKVGVRYAADLAELRRVVEAYPAGAYPLLLQQRIVGPGVGIFLLLWDGEIVARFAHRRIREKPPAGGISVYRESIPADPGLVDRSLALLRCSDWEGVAMVEYKVEATTGVPYLMEVNGRFWGSLQLAVDAGVDFPALLVSLALGERPAPVTSYRTGVRSRWWLGDLDHLLARLRYSPDTLALPPGSPSRGRALLDFLTLWRPDDRSEILRWDDLRPGLRETRLWLRGE